MHILLFRPVQSVLCDSDYVFIRPTETAKSKSSMKLTPDSKQQYIETQFADQSGKFYCRVYFPEEFHQLRSVVFPYGEDRYDEISSNQVAIGSISDFQIHPVFGAQCGMESCWWEIGVYILKNRRWSVRAQADVSVGSTVVYGVCAALFLVLDSCRERKSMSGSHMGVARLFDCSLIGFLSFRNPRR